MMKNDQVLSADGMLSESTRAERLDLLTDALLSYLEEIEDYRSICLRHEHTTHAYATPRALHLVKLFPWKAETVASLRHTAERLLSWTKSPFWKSEQRDWMTLLWNSSKRPTVGSHPSLLTQGIVWEGRPVLVCASSVGGERFLRIELLLPPIPAELPELPLRVVARGLLCLECLLPKHVAVAIPTSTIPQTRALPLLQYLRRAMPQNLYASQCFSLDTMQQ